MPRIIGFGALFSFFLPPLLSSPFPFFSPTLGWTETLQPGQPGEKDMIGCTRRDKAFLPPPFLFSPLFPFFLACPASRSRCPACRAAECSRRSCFPFFPPSPFSPSSLGRFGGRWTGKNASRDVTSVTRKDRLRPSIFFLFPLPPPFLFFPLLGSPRRYKREGE